MKKLSVALCALTFSTAFAAGPGQQHRQAQQAPAKQELTWEALKESCDRPAQYHNQNPPKNIVVTCEDTVVTWERQRNSETTLPTDRNLAFSVTSDKYEVALDEAEQEIAPSRVACPVYKEVKRTYATQVGVTCDMVKAAGTLEEFCRSTVDSDLTKNAALAHTEETGLEVDGCDLRERATARQQQQAQQKR